MLTALMIIIALAVLFAAGWLGLFWLFEQIERLLDIGDY